MFLTKYHPIITPTDSLNKLSGSGKIILKRRRFRMKHLVKLLMVTFLISSVSVLFAQGPVDKSKDETVKAKSSNTKDAKGSSASRLTDDTDAPTKDAGNDEAVKGKSSFFGKLFGGKSAPEGHSSKSAASSRGGSSKKGGKGSSKGSSVSSSKGAAQNAPTEKGQEEKGQGGGR